MFFSQSSRAPRNLPSFPSRRSSGLFPGVPLVSSRNGLIYFGRALQDRALGLFAQSLPPAGFLGLGSKETVHFSAEGDSFAEFAQMEKIWRRTTHNVQEHALAE